MPLKAIILQNHSYSYEWIKSRRKTIAVRIQAGGAMEVRAPLWISLQEVEKFLRQKEEWIIKTICRAEELQNRRPVWQFETGSLFSFLGKDYFLEVREETGRKRSHVVLAEDKILLTIPQDPDQTIRKSALQNWYREQARAILTDKAERFAPFMGVTFSGICIKEQKSRWGSCSARGNLNFNWHIIMAPETIADYLVIHELSHLRHMNHSAEFWHCVETFYPEYRQARKWLRERGDCLRKW